MKKPLLLVLTSIAIATNAQTLVDTNKVWNVVTCINFGPCWTSVFYFDGDTTIGIHQYKKLMVSYDTSGGGYFSSYVAREDTATNQVFFNSSGSEYLAYDFSLNQGDTFTTDIDGCTIQMTVDSVDTVTLLNGESRKRMLLSNLETWIEGVGSLYGLTNVGVYFCSFDIFPELNCFTENDTLKYQNLNYPDCFYALGISGLTSHDTFKLIPNPFSEFTTLTFENPLHERNLLKIFSTDGQIIKQYENVTGNQLRIDRSKMINGIYFFQLMNDTKLIATGKLVVE